MTRETLQTILRAADGITEKSGVFRVASEHRVTFYLGTDGRGMVVNEIEEIRLADGFVTLISPDVGSVYADYAGVYTVSVKPPKPNAPNKAGFA